MTAADLCAEMLADDVAALQEANRQLVDLVADLGFENTVLRTLYEKELVLRIHGDAAVDRFQRRRPRSWAA